MRTARSLFCLSVTLTNIVVAAATAGVRAVAVVHGAGGQPGRPLVTPRWDVFQTHETSIGQHLEDKVEIIMM